MAASRILFPEFREEQSGSKYPFADSASLRSADNRVTFAKNVFIDASFYPIGGGASVYIARVVVAPNRVAITIQTTSPEVRASAEYNPLALPTSNTLVFYDDYARPAGIIIFDRDRIGEIYQWSFGEYVFNRTSAAFVATACIPAREPGVRGLTVDGKNFITGDVCLVGDAGVVLRVEEENVIRVDTVGVPLFQRDACDDAGKTTQPPRFVRTINNCVADEFGNFTITATDRGVAADDATVLRVYPANFGLTVEAIGRGAV